MKKFEYKIEHFLIKETDSWLHSGSIERTFNYLGAEGWELVKVGDKVAFFKREITPEVEMERIHEQALRENERRERSKIEAMNNEEYFDHRYANASDTEKAYLLIEQYPQLKGNSKVYQAIAQLKNEEITFDEFEAKIDELIQ